MIHTLDLNFLGYQHAIAAYLIPTDDGPVLIETGPHSCADTLESAVNSAGFKLSEIKNVLLSHIHLDHAGGAWALAEKGANIFVHPFGIGHLAAPEKLMESARRIYQESMDVLWGQMNPVPEDRLFQVEHNEILTIGNTQFCALHTPGHARHHIAWQVEKTIFTGDVAGVKIENGPVVPPCPPPDIHLEHWNQSIELLLEKNPESLYLTHFGKITDITSHLNALKEMLNDWAAWIYREWKKGISQETMTEEFSKYTTAQLRKLGVDDEGILKYEAANPSWMSVAGLVRYWSKKEAGKLH
jgi:glyoxylase-like metal-dependent hydrolase (beta-lactamase superfamily II)